MDWFFPPSAVPPAPAGLGGSEGELTSLALNNHPLETVTSGKIFPFDFTILSENGDPQLDGPPVVRQLAVELVSHLCWNGLVAAVDVHKVSDTSERLDLALDLVDLEDVAAADQCDSEE